MGTAKSALKDGQGMRDGACRCGCGGAITTKARFMAGHDARFLSNLRKDFEAGQTSRDDALAAAEGISPAMGRKLARSLELAAGRMAAGGQDEAAGKVTGP